MAFVLFVLYIPNEQSHQILDQQPIEDDTAQENADGADLPPEQSTVSSANSESSSCSKSEKTNQQGENEQEQQEQNQQQEPQQQEEDITSSDAKPGSTEEKNVDQSQKNNTSGHDIEFVEFLQLGTLYERLKETLTGLQILNDVWKFSEDGSYIQISFIVESGLQCDEIIRRLSGIGIGVTENTTLSVFPTSIHMQYEKDIDDDQTCSEETGTQFSYEEKETEFKKSIKSRLIVAQVVESVKSNAQLTFDYIMFIFLASWIAALGLGENSSVILVASMLISPLMGPILAAIFGTVVKNDDLRNLGIKSELIGLAICLGFGLFAGFIYGGLGVQGHLLGNSESWPTEEMASRGVPRCLVAGILIAIPSGAGVALSILGGNTGSLVGVAISASLLPPAVNAGMLWSLAICAAVSPPSLVPGEDIRLTVSVNSTNSSVPTYTVYLKSPGNCTAFLNNAYQPTYSCSMAEEAAILGAVSLLLTMLNIVAIFLVGLMVLKLKEVAPKTSPSSVKEYFFTKDLKVARESYQTTKGQHSKTLGKKFLEEYKKIKMPDIDEEIDDEETQEEIKTLYFKEVLEEVENSPEVHAVLSGLNSPPPMSLTLKDLFSDAQRNVNRIEEENYKTLTKPPAGTDSHARVYRTFHAADLYNLMSPTPQDMKPFHFGTKPPLRKRHTYSALNTGHKRKPRPKLKLDTQKKPGTFKMVTIKEGEDIPNMPSEKPRFEVEPVRENNLTEQTDVQYEPQMTPELEMKPLIARKK